MILLFSWVWNMFCECRRRT